MRILIESLAVIGAVAILAGIGFFTLCFMAATPSKKSVYPESNHDHRSNHALNERGLQIVGPEPKPMTVDEMVGYMQIFTTGTDSKDSKEILDTAIPL